MSGHNLSRLRADIDWLIERRPFEASRLAEAVALLEVAHELERKAERLMESIGPAMTDRQLDTGNRRGG